VHIFSYLAASYLKKRIGIKLIYEVRDIWPLSLIELAEVSPLNPIIIWMKRIERNAYTEADAVVSLLPNALEHMQPLGLSPERFHYIPNGINKEEWNTNSVAIPETHKKVFDWCKDKNKLIVIYTGSMGPPNALDQIFELKSFIDSREAPYHFVLIGSGSLKEKLKKAVKKEKIKFISILPRVASEIVPAILKLGDVCFIGWQKKQIYCLGISPNKLNEYFKAAKPVLHAVQAFNDPVKESGAGLSVEPYNPKQLDAALRKFFNMSEEERILVGRKGRNYLQDRLDWSTLGNKYLNLCLKLTE
jgi:glycosyltransferase involved in cell wall biosynthesis